MKTFLIVLLVIASFALIISILLSPAKVAGMGGAIEGGAETLFGRKKARGLEAILEKITIGSAIIFMLSAFIYSLLA